MQRNAEYLVIHQYFIADDEEHFTTAVIYRDMSEIISSRTPNV